MAPDRKRALVFFFTTRYSQKADYPVIRFQGLEAGKKYRIREINRADQVSGHDVDGNRKKSKPATDVDGKILSGDFLMKHGIQFNLNRSNESAILELETQ